MQSNVHESRTRVRILSATVMVCACFAGAVAAAPPESVWIEAEKYAETNFKEHLSTSNMGKPGLLSGGEWIMRGVSAKDVAQIVPAEGVTLRYDVDVAKAGRYDLWARVGWFYSRADFRWRVGGGEWTDAPAKMHTINLMEIAFFCEASWSKLDAVDLKAGRTSLELVYPKVTGAGKRMLMALDCFVFVNGAFTPEGPFKPGETYAAEKDVQAAEHIFKMPKPQGDARTDVKLVGLWQVARFDDPDMDKDSYLPVPKLPTPEEYALRWMGLEVPFDPWGVEPLVFGHRLLYRTRVDVPAGHKGRGFKLHFSGTHWIVSVFVNGRLAGSHKGVWVPWDLDVSGFIEPGRVNEITVAVKGTYYATDAKALGKSRNTKMAQRNRPRSRVEHARWVAPIYPSTKGDGDGYVYGIVNPVTLISVGNAYTEDVFVKPSVGKKQLGLVLTVRNTGAAQRTLGVKCEAVNDRTGQVEKSWTLPALAIAAGKTHETVSDLPWADPKLWWPVPEPNLYRLRTTISEGGKVLDVHEQLFGFREVTVKGPGIYINGVRRNFWNWVDVAGAGVWTPENWVAKWREEGNRFMRFSHGRKITASLKSREERLDFYDRNGVAGRLCTMIDGMFSTVSLGQILEGEDENGLRNFTPNAVLWENYREHMAQVAKAYRNHPSVIFYQAENELVYIRGMNAYGRVLEQIEGLMAEVCDAGRQIDPTRPYTVGGGGDLRHAVGKAQAPIEINSPHYPTGNTDWYPENAYTIKQYSTKITRWPWTRERPWVVGESLHASELRLGTYACGPEAFRSRADSKRTKARFLRAVYDGYRWAGAAGFFPWDNLSDWPDGRKIYSDLYACPRKQTHRLYAGRESRLLFKILNDTFSAEPVTFEWSYEAGGRTVASDKATMDIEPGFGKEYTIVLKAPQSSVRLDGVLNLKVSQKGAPDYVDKRAVPTLPVVTKLAVAGPVYVLDRKGATADWLAAVGVTLQRIDGLEALKGKKGLLVIGHETLTSKEAFSALLLAFAAGGGRVICLEQDVPISGAAASAPLRTTTRFGGYAHPQALGTPVLRDLGKEDLIDWAGDFPTYKNVYEKPTEGARSLVECGPMLPFSALIEMSAGEGAVVVCQLRVGAKLGVDPAADVLLRNLVECYAEYTPSAAVAAVYAPADAMLADKITATGALNEKVASLADALDPAKFRVAVVHADAANLTELDRLKAKAHAFQDAGGWIMLCGVAPDSIDGFNKFMGTKHLLRPFRIERVLLKNPTYKLAATLGDADVALLSAKVQQASSGRIWISGNTFSYVIDNENVAPFTFPEGAPDEPYAYKPTWNDKDPFNYVNGMRHSDFWRYIRQIWIEEVADPIEFRLRQPEAIRQINISNDAAYSTIKDLEIYFDGDKANPLKVVLPDGYETGEIVLPEPRTVQKSITLQIVSHRIRPHKNPNAPHLVGIEEVQFLRAKPASDGIGIDNVGGLVVFPRGKGGVFLNQVKFMANEPRKSNADTKVKLTGVILQNMGIGSRASNVAIPGHNIRYTPIDITDHCNSFLKTGQGKRVWFGSRDGDMAALQVGRQRLNEVVYHLTDYDTAPVPNCVVLRYGDALKDQAVRGIKIGRKADVLFFLHAASVMRPVTEDERSRIGARKRAFVLPTLGNYEIRYADGKTVVIPIILEKSIDHWVQKEPKPLEQASVAWDAPSKVADGVKGVLYSMKVTNPRPDVEIESVGLANAIQTIAPRGKPAYQRAQRRADIAFLAVTLGEIIQ
jgi:glycosyl hydrolase family 2